MVMMYKFSKFFFFAFVIFAMTSCWTDDDFKRLQQECHELHTEKEQLTQEIKVLKENIEILKAKYGLVKQGKNPTYIVALKIEHSAGNLSIDDHLKHDSTIRMEIPVDKEFFDSVNIGEMLSKKYGSFSIYSNTSVTVENKYVK